MANLGKRTRSIRETVKNKENLSVEDAVALVKSNATAKFDETIEIAMNLGVDTRHADQMVRGVIGLPNGTGKSVRVAVFARGPKAEEAQAAGAVGGAVADRLNLYRIQMLRGVGGNIVYMEVSLNGSMHCWETPRCLQGDMARVQNLSKGGARFPWKT